MRPGIQSTFTPPFIREKEGITLLVEKLSFYKYLTSLFSYGRNRASPKILLVSNYFYINRHINVEEVPYKEYFIYEDLR